jgi:hypothetical protein
VSYNNDSMTGAGVILWVLAIGAILFGSWQCKVSECRQVCSANHDVAVQTFTNGCFCKDNDGRLYNPADSR